MKSLQTDTIKKIKAKKFLALGYGVNAYFDTLSLFIALFAVLTVLNIPLMMVYHSQDGLENVSGVAKTAFWTLGNFGYS